MNKNALFDLIRGFGYTTSSQTHDIADAVIAELESRIDKAEVAASWIVHDPKGVIGELRKTAHALLDAAGKEIGWKDNTELSRAAAALDSALAAAVGIEDAVRPAAPVVAEGWRGAAEWLKNNYQAHTNIADLCEAMIAAHPVAGSPAEKPIGYVEPGCLEELAKPENQKSGAHVRVYAVPFKPDSQRPTMPLYAAAPMPASEAPGQKREAHTDAEYLDRKAKFFREATAAPVPASEAASRLRGEVMNLPENYITIAQSGWTNGEVKAYKIGHRDARHAAAELVSANLAAPAALTDARPDDWKVGNLLTMSDSDYPGMGSMFAQVWQGDDLIARVYGDNADEVRTRANIVAAQSVRDAAQCLIDVLDQGIQVTRESVVVKALRRALI